MREPAATARRVPVSGSEITQQHVSDTESITLGITVIAAFGAVISSLFKHTADFSVSSDEAASL